MNPSISTDHLDLIVSESVYQPREDSYFMMKTMLNINFRENMCEIGCGTGFSILSLAKENSNFHYIATDINYLACELTMKNAYKNNILNIQLVCGNGIQSFRKNSLPRIIFFNPPYLPSDPILDQVLSNNDLRQFVGGDKGYELASKLINNLGDNYILFIIISSLATNPVIMQDLHPEHSIKVEASITMDDGELLWIIKVRRIT